MKVRINRVALAEASAWVAQAIAKNAGASVMAGMKLTAIGDRITLSGFDYETAHAAVLDADVLDPGECVVSGRFFVQIVTALDGKDLDLTLEDSRLTLSSGRSTYRARTMPVGDYPSLPEMPKVVGTIDRDSLVEATSTTEHAVARGGNLPILAALNLRGSAKELTIAATDRFRVARVTSPLSKGKKFEANVPASAIIGAIKGLAGTVALGCDGGLFGVSDGRRSITTRIVGDGDPFPAIDVLFEKVPPDSIEVDGALLAEAVKRSLLVTEEHDLILVEVSGEAQMIHVSTDSELGEGVEEVECEGGTSIALRFNGSYLLQALNAATAGRVRISTSTPTAAVRIEPVGDESVAFIVMPRRSKK